MTPTATLFREATGDMCDAEIESLVRMLDEGEDVLACDRLRRVIRERREALHGSGCSNPHTPKCFVPVGSPICQTCKHWRPLTNR